MMQMLGWAWFNDENNWEEFELPCSCKMVKAKNFYANIDSVCDEEIEIGYNFEELNAVGAKMFRADFVERCPMAKGFASVTLSLLHELGHFSSQQDFDGYDRDAVLKEMAEKFPIEMINFIYFMLPDEMSATDWAIEWLSDPEHRKTAKKFEKEFFKCFK